MKGILSKAVSWLGIAVIAVLAVPAGVLILLIIGICASIFPAVYIEAPMDKEWVRAYSRLSGFLMTNNLCWLF